MCYIELNLNWLFILVVLIDKIKAGFCNQAFKLIFLFLNMDTIWKSL